MWTRQHLSSFSSGKDNQGVNQLKYLKWRANVLCEFRPSTCEWNAGLSSFWSLKKNRDYALSKGGRVGILKRSFNAFLNEIHWDFFSPKPSNLLQFITMCLQNWLEMAIFVNIFAKKFWKMSFVKFRIEFHENNRISALSMKSSFH